MYIQQIIERLNRKLISTPSSGEETICLIRFYNCTKHSIKIFWLNYTGGKVDYNTIKPGVSYNIDTHRNHVWLFKVVDDDKPHVKPNGVMRILAIPEEYMNFYRLNDRFNNTMNTVTLPTSQRAEQLDRSQDLNCQPAQLLTNHRPSFVYSCVDLDHVDDHCETRRTIYLVEPVPNLKELCILALNKGFDKRYQIRKQFYKYNIPIDLGEECLQYLSMFWLLEKKLDARRDIH